MQVFVVECGECGRFRGRILGGSGRWLLGECGGEVWETSGGCGDGFAVEKVVLVELGVEGLWRRILGKFLGGFGIWKKHKEAGVLGGLCV